jgi:hypothetical protein
MFKAIALAGRNRTESGRLISDTDRPFRVVKSLSISRNDPSAAASAGIPSLHRGIRLHPRSFPPPWWVYRVI